MIQIAESTKIAEIEITYHLYYRQNSSIRIKCATSRSLIAMTSKMHISLLSPVHCSQAFSAAEMAMVSPRRLDSLLVGSGTMQD